MVELSLGSQQVLPFIELVVQGLLLIDLIKTP